MSALMTDAEARLALTEIYEVIGEKLTSDECTLIARLLDCANNRADRAEAELKRWPTTDDGRLTDDDLAEICHLVAHLNGETVIEQVRAAVASSASSEPAMLDSDAHPWPTDGSEFEVIFKRPESVIATYVEYKNRHLTTDGYSITDHHREPEGWLPIEPFKEYS